MKKLLVVGVVVLVGCGAVPRSTGVMNLGPDTFRVAARASLGQAGEGQRMALSEGHAYCRTLNREFLAISTRLLTESGTFEVTFRCLKAGDPDLIRPTLEKEPNTVIQVR
jgi:hypothetical protein